MSKRHGLVAVFARPDMATEEGVRLGDTRQQVRGAYGGPVTTDPFVTVPLSDGTSYVFGFDRDRLVSIVRPGGQPGLLPVTARGPRT